MKNLSIAAVAILAALPAAAQSGDGWADAPGVRAVETSFAADKAAGGVVTASDGEPVRAAGGYLVTAAEPSAAAPAAKPDDSEAIAAQAQAAGITSTQQILNMRRKTLEALYKRLAPGPIPDGASDGIASREPGTWYGRVSETVLGAFWQGKVFDRANGQLINRLTTGKAVKAKVFYGESWLDGKPSIIIDYKDTSGIAGFIRDEIREAAPGIYYGFAYERQKDGSAHADIIFALDFNKAKK